MKTVFWPSFLLLLTLSPLAIADDPSVDEGLVNATRTIVSAIATQAQRDLEMDGDELSEFYVQTAADAASALPLKIRRQAFLLGLAIACDDTGVLARTPSEKKMIASVDPLDSRRRRLGNLGSPTIYQRMDLWSHFIVSCYLTARSEMEGEKAVRTIRAVFSGALRGNFSFAHLAAELSGVEFSRAIQERRIALADISSDFTVRDYVVYARRLPQDAAVLDVVQENQLEAAVQKIVYRLKRLPPYWVPGDVGRLKPDEVAIIAVRNSLESQEVAAYYARARGIPMSHICWIETEPNKDISRKHWEYHLRPTIRNWLVEQQLANQIRCLVTVWDVPYKIGKRSEYIARHQAFLLADRRHRVRQCREAIIGWQAIGANTGRDDTNAVTEALTVEELGQAFQQEQASVLQRIQGLLPEERNAALQRYTAVLTKVGGLRAVLASIQKQQQAQGEASPLGKQVALLQGRLLGLQEAANTVGRLPDTVERDEQMLAIVSTAAGALGAVQWLDGQLSALQKNETYSSFDSELSLLFWLDYPLLRWQMNPLHYRYDNSPLRLRQHTLMVSRLEAPSVAITKRLIDDAIAVEKSGLQGTMFLDARGIKGEPGKNSRGSYASYDQSLRDLKGVMSEHSENEVVLDNRSGLFQPGDCADTSLYCGWYSLAKYVDAFEFKRGAVGYHMASSEAVTLRGVDSQVWCKRMLEDGICATLGPVHEPYLSAFPLPDEFFVAFASGRYSLVEAYYRTKPFNSWVMVLVGDPLYNPFRKAPGIALDNIPEKYQRILQLEEER